MSAFDEVLPAVLPEGEAAGHGSELYERRGAFLELAESEGGITVHESLEHGLAVRLFRHGRVAFAAAGPEQARSLVPTAQLLLPRSRSRRGARAPARLPGEDAESVPSPTPARPAEATARDVLASFRRALTTVGDGAVVAREASVSAGERSERIATSAGRQATWVSRSASLVATVVGRSGQRRFSARVVATASRLEELPVARLARVAADRVLLPLTGKAPALTRSDLLLDSHVAAHLIGRLAPLFFGDADPSVLERRLADGRGAIAGSPVSLIDDPQAAGGPVRSARDGEGTPQRRTVVVSRGAPTGLLTDTATGGRAPHPHPSGNAVRMAWSEPPRIGVTNFHVDPSPGVSPLDLLGDVQKGVYAAVLLERPDVDLSADRFRLVAAGYAIEKGRAAERLTDVVIAGRLSDLLLGIAGLGDDLKFVAAAGGGAGSPTLLIPRWKW